ncbi:Transcription Factor Hivep2 [Manis pentadactyla]|nr:Transcription Factor Hivep2 [Manis pentadactyla]
MGREIESKEEKRDLEAREDPPFEGQAIPGRQISADRLLGEKSVSRFSWTCKGEKIWNHKVENFFLSVWKKLFVMNGILGVRARRGERRKGGEISRLPLALGLDVNIYYVCLFSPRRWLRSAATNGPREEGGRKGRGGPAPHVTPRGANVRS